VEEFTLFVLPWLLWPEDLRERRDFVEMWIQRALEYPFQTTLVGMNRQAQPSAATTPVTGAGQAPHAHPNHHGTEDILVPPLLGRSPRPIVGSRARPHSRGGPHALLDSSRLNETILRFLRKHLN